MPRRKVDRVFIGVEFRSIQSKGGNPSFDELLVDRLKELKRTQGEEFIADKIKSLIRIAYASGWPDNEHIDISMASVSREKIEAIPDDNSGLDDNQVATIPDFLIPKF